MAIEVQKIYKREDGSVVRVVCRIFASSNCVVYDVTPWVRGYRKRKEDIDNSAASLAEKQEVALAAWELIKPNITNPHIMNHRHEVAP